MARFLGVATELTTHVDGATITTPWGPLPAPEGCHGAVVIGLRPADLVVDPDGPLAGTVRATWFRRDHFLVELTTPYGPMTATASTPLAVGTAVTTQARLKAAVVLAP